MNLADRLDVPDSTEALLLDLDGIIINSLALDLELVPNLIDRRWPSARYLPTGAVIRRMFALPVPLFWQQLLAELGIDAGEDDLSELIRWHDQARQSATFTVFPGIAEVLDAAAAVGVRTCVVSNNESSAVRAILRRLPLLDPSLTVIGLDDVGGLGKPDPALYREAADRCGTTTQYCVAVEDSLVGLASSSSAGCFSVGVATGATSFAELEDSGMADRVYTSLTAPIFDLTGGDPRRKSITTPNEFVTHMVEHILWRLGTGATLVWPNNDWVELGQAFGAALTPKIGPGEESAVIGMIDDGSCETAVERGSPALTMEAAYGVDLNWFVGLACEQVRSGKPLVELLEGLARGAELSLRTKICSFEDPHHTWEGLFRSVGMCLRDLGDDTGHRRPDAESTVPIDAVELDPLSSNYGWSFSGLTTTGGAVTRNTAESVVSVTLEISRSPGCRARFELSDTIDVDEFRLLLDAFARAAGVFVEVDFKASVLSSSHVVTEDIGVALGKLLLRIAELRWATVGMSGAGSSVRHVTDFDLPARAAISIEGRKFWKFVSLNSGFGALRKGLLVGHIIGSTVRSEDLDDFVDGLSGGLGASVIIHVDTFSDPTATWYAIFTALGQSLRQAFAADPFRIGLPPGVKATLV